MKKIMYKAKIISIFILFFWISAEESGAATINVVNGNGQPSCDQADVQAAINAASEGDILICPSGSWTWTRGIVIDKSVTLRGQTTGCPSSCSAGTIIKRGASVRLITVHSNGDLKVDISGFTLDSDHGSDNLILVYNSSTNIPLYNLRIHHNEFKNATGGVAFQVGLSGGGSGLVFGLLDNNKFDNNNYMFKIWGAGTPEWAAFPSIDNEGTTNGGSLLNAGSRNYMYLEDNISSNTLTFLGSSGTGARWVFRYNTASSVAGGTQSLCLDAHGDTLNRGVVGFEAYGNTFTKYISQCFAYRGGAGIIFNNNWNFSSPYEPGGIEVNEDSPGCVCTNPGGCPGGYGPAGDEVYNGYIWNNYNFTRSVRTEIQENDPYDAISSQVNYWADTDAEGNDTGYFVKGSASKRNVNICTPQTVYWETDTMKLYRCTATNIWTYVYTPYTYPHPLRNEDSGGGILPAAPKGLDVR